MSAPQWFIYLVLGLSGLCFGSFLNVIVYRLPRRLSLQKPPSSCSGAAAAIAGRGSAPAIPW